MNTLRIAVLILFAQIPQQTATVQGTVSKTQNGAPIAGARVDLVRVDGTTPQTYTTTAGPDGAFEIPNARPGAYRIAAARPGYLRREFGQRSKTGNGLTINLEAGQRLRDIEIVLPPAAAISGRVTDRQGDPAAATEVRALTPTYRTGQRVLQIVQSTLTNDLGEYRLFGLASGQYYISAMPPANSTFTSLIINGTPLTVTPTSISGETYTAVYYPGTTDSRTSTPVDVSNGGDYGGVNITIAPLVTHHIRGEVLGGMAHVTLVPADPGLTRSLRNEAAIDGPFDFSNIASGEYTLVARSEDMMGMTPVNVREGDLENVTVGMSPTVSVPTRVVIDDRPPTGNDPDLESVNLNLTADPPIPGEDPDVYGPFPDGSLSFGVSPHENYRITNLTIRNMAAPLTGRLRDAYIKSIRMGTTDVLNDGFRIDDQAKTEPIEIVLGTRPGSLSGTVMDEQQKPGANVTVLLVPDAGRRRWPDAYRIVATDIAGRYFIDRIPPGDYIVYAWEEVEDGAWMDPEFMKKYDDRGTHVHIGEGSNPALRITALP